MASVLDKYIQQLSTGTSVANKPAGGINAYNIDPRLGKSYQQLVSAVNSGISSEPAGTDVLSRYLNQLTDFSKPAKKNLNPLQQVLSNRVVQTGLKPLEILDYGRRGLTSLAKESYDYGKTGTFSVEDLKTQTQDPTFGVGKFVNTGNKWADRGLGFAGDVALDPLNYLTLGAGQFVGAGGRAALAAKLVRSGADEAVVSKAGRLGLAGLSNAEREAFSLPRAGLYVGNPSKSGVRIPGTGVVGQGLGRGLSETRSLIGSTPVGGVVRRARTPEMFIEAAERLAKGRGAMSATEAASLLSAGKRRAGVEAVVRAEIDQELVPVIEGIRSSADPVMVTNALERGDLSNPVVAQVREQFDRNFNRMSAPEMGAISPDRYRTNYVPRIWTEAGQNILSGESPFAKQFRQAFGVTVDDVRSPTATMARVLNIEPGKVYNIGGKELTFATDTIDEINRVFAREFPQLGGAKVLEDDITKLLSGHSRQTAQAIGNQALARELEALGVGKAVALASTGVVDKKATKVAEKAQKAATAQFVDDMAPRVKAAEEAQKVIVKEYNDTLDAVSNAVVITLKTQGAALGEEMQLFQRSFNEFLVRSKNAQTNLETQGRYLDKMAEFLTRKIDESNSNLEKIAQFSDSAEYQLLLADKAYADQMLFHVKTAQANLDDALKKTDELFVTLPTQKGLPKEVYAASRKRSDELSYASAKNAEPYRVVEGGEVVGKQVNAKIGLDSSYNDVREQIVGFSPEANKTITDARNKLDEASSIETRLKTVLAQEKSSAEKVRLYNAFKREYDTIVGVLKRVSERAQASGAKGSERFIVEEGNILSLPQDILDNYLYSARYDVPGAVNRDQFEMIKRFEQEYLPAVEQNAKLNNELRSMQESYGVDFELDADGNPMPVEGLAAVRRMRQEANAALSNAKNIAMKEMQDKLFSNPWISINVKNAISDKYSELFDAYIETVAVRNRMGAAKDLTSVNARAAANDAIAIQSRLETAAANFRIAADFSQRFQKTVDLMARSGQVFNSDAIATMVARNVISDEIKLVKGQLSVLLEAREAVTKAAADQFDVAMNTGNKSAAARAALEFKTASDRSAGFIYEQLKEYDIIQRKINEAERGARGARDLSPKQLEEIGYASSATGFSSFDVVSESLSDLIRQKKEIQDTIELIIKGGKGQSQNETFDFKKFIKDVYGKEKGAKGSQIKLERVQQWIVDNEAYGVSSNGYKRMAYETKGLSEVERQKARVVDVLNEQILETEAKIKGLKRNGELLGRQPDRLSKADRVTVESLVDMKDPVAVAADTAAKAQRTAEIETELTKLDEAIAAKQAEGKAAAGKQKYYQPSREEQQQLRELNKTLDVVRTKIGTQDFTDETMGFNNADVLVSEQKFRAAGKRAEEAKKVFTKAQSASSDAEKKVDDLRRANVPDKDIRMRKAKKNAAKLREELSAAREEYNVAYGESKNATPSSGFSPLQTERQRLAAKEREILLKIKKIEDRQLRFVGQGPSAKIFTEQQALIAHRDALVREAKDLATDIAYNKSVINNPLAVGKLPRGKGLKNWESVLLGGDPTDSRRALRNFRIKRQQFWEQELLAKKELDLPKGRFDVPGYTENITGFTPNEAGFTPASQYPLKNQNQINARIAKISKNIEDAGGEEAIVKKISEHEAELATLDSALLKAKIEPNTPFSIAGTTLDQAKQRKKYVQNLLNQQKGLLRSIDERDALGLELKAGRKPIAEARVASTTEAMAARETEIAGAPFAQAAERETADVARRENLLNTSKANRQQVQAELDNTRRIAEDANAAASEALIEVRDQIALVERNAKMVIDQKVNKEGRVVDPFNGKPNAPKVKDASNMETIEASSKWLDEALAMTDPAQYNSRVGATDVSGDLLGGTSEAEKFAYLFSMNYTPEQKATAALVAKAHSLEGQMLTAVENKQAVEAMIRGAKDMKFPAIMKQQIQDGWQEISKSGIVVPQPVADAMTRIMRLDKPNEWRRFWSAWDTYTDVFKAYATLSPRFHVRNSLSATLMNYSDGVSSKSMIDGVKYWREFKNNPSGWLDNVPADERKMIAEAVMSTHATGAGQYQEFKIGTPGTRNRVVKASQNIGTTVEGSVRLGMAIDTLRRGGSFDEAVARINRVHFNYSDVSKVDGYAKKVIPFWTFMSRNLPLQMQQMWLKPRLYAIYDSAVRNFTDDEDNSIVPSYMMDSGAFKSPIGGGLITPDMPWIKSRQDIMNLAGPRGWISSSTPLVKLPIELYTGKSAFTGAPIKNPALYAAQQALPLYQTFERLGGVGSQGAKQGSNIAGFLGVPYQQPTVGMQNSELLNRLALAKQAIERARK